MEDFSDPFDFLTIVKRISINHGERRLFLKVVSIDTDLATNETVKVTNPNTIDLTEVSGIQRVKSRITASGKYMTTNIKVKGFTDGVMSIDDSFLSDEDQYLEITYTIKQAPGNRMNKGELLAKIMELRNKGITVYGEDIAAKIDLKDSMNGKYSLGENIQGEVDFSGLYTHADVTDYVKALQNDISLDGEPLDSVAKSDKTIIITLDDSILTSNDFTSRFGIQFRINGGD